MSVWTAYYVWFIVCFSKYFKSIMLETIHVILQSYIKHVNQKGCFLFTYAELNIFIEPEVENDRFCILPHDILCFSFVTLPCLLHF